MPAERPNLHAQRVAAGFSTVVAKELTRSTVGDVAHRLEPILRAVSHDAAATLAEAFDSAFSSVDASYRTEYVYKTHLLSKIVFGRHTPRTTSALFELPMGRSCADVVIMNGTSTTYEIKTDYDDFSRLTTQAADYVTRTEHVNLVVSDSRAAAAEQILPARVGLLSMRRNGSFSVVRPSVSNLDRLNIDHLYALLRKPEAERLLKHALGYKLDVGRGRAWGRMRDVFRELSVWEAHRGVVTQLRLRGRAAADLTMSPGFPSSLRCLAYAMEPTSVAADRLRTRLSEPASAFLAG